ncbi:SDR family NAD(P)-dependent oxidoreductase [Pectobacterium versatile]|uniref:SDR family NAD(P)-dependent oxidoreductase n=2 Tax=Pectobacterium versatile TaxID=2488639 RepID=UPI003AFA9DFA
MSAIRARYMKSKVILVTGASSGIGEAAALRLKASGHTVYAAARRIERMQKLAEADIRVLPLDVTDSVSVQTVVDTIIAECGRIDVVVNNAGYGSYGAVEEVSPEEGRAQFDVNVFGAVTANAVGSAAYAGTTLWHGDEYHLDGWKNLYPARCLVSRNQVCPGSDQRLSASGSGAFRH